MTDPAVYRRSNLREVLLERALAVLEERGEGALSLRELARDVGVSHAAPARHFADRSTLIEALAVEGFRQLKRELGGATSGGSVYAHAERTAQAYLTFALTKKNLVDVMFRHETDADRTAIGSNAAKAFDPLLRLFERARQEGNLREGGDARAVATLFLATLQGIVALVSCGVVDPHAASHLIADLIPRYLEDPESVTTQAAP
jgi:AcrR family transcriptional regulator